MPTIEEIRERLKQVFDPEVHVSIVDLGLVYDIQIQEEKNVQIKMTLTSQGCPAAQQIPDMIRAKIEALPTVKAADVQVVWEPQWKPSMISPEGKKILHLEDEE